MPSDNPDAYKEMYEMGNKLIDMAKAGGYSPDSESSDSYEESEEYSSESSEKPSSSYKGKDKGKLALSFL